MTSKELASIQQLKISCLSRGIRVSKEAADQLSQGGAVPLTIREYATTGGVTLKLAGDVYLNAPFDEWYCNDPEASLHVNPVDGAYNVEFRGESFPAQVLPLPGYLDTVDSQGRLARAAVMSHVDRARLSPVDGCSFSCRFCDSSIRSQYAPRPLDQLLEALEVARQDSSLPVKHILISGGTPRPDDYPYYDEVCEAIIQHSDIPVDVMMWPRPDDIIDRLFAWGVFGYALNLEIYDEDTARRLAPQKRHSGRAHFARQIERALELTGGNGRVRSLLIVGLEPIKKTLEGVEFLARLGCDPVLSPFRPAPGTLLQDIRPPSIEQLEEVYLEALEIVDRHGVKLGPRCIPCQHNTLTFPDDSQDYYYS